MEWRAHLSLQNVKKNTPLTLNDLRRKERNVLKELKQNGVTVKKDLLIVGTKENTDERTYLGSNSNKLLRLNVVCLANFQKTLIFHFLKK